MSILSVGERWVQWDRVKSALISQFYAVPILIGYPKDYKPFAAERIATPPIRAVCGNLESKNGTLSDLLAEVITTLGDEMDRGLKTLCLSTEAMIVGMEKVNREKENIRKLVLALGLYLTIMQSRAELVVKGLGEVTHRRKKGGEGSRGRKIRRLSERS